MVREELAIVKVAIESKGDFIKIIPVEAGAINGTSVFPNTEEGKRVKWRFTNVSISWLVVEESLWPRQVLLFDSLVLASKQ